MTWNFIPRILYQSLLSGYYSFSMSHTPSLTYLILCVYVILRFRFDALDLFFLFYVIMFIRSFLHSFILAISIAPFQVLYYSEVLPTTARILYRSFTPKRTGNCR